MRTVKYFLILIAIHCVFAVGFATDNKTDSSSAIPTTTFVYDDAGMLSFNEMKKVVAKLESYTRTSGNRIVLYTERKSPDVSPSDRASQIERRWISSDSNNLIVVYIAAVDRAIEIRIGDSLIPNFSDQLIAQIKDEELTPHFKEGRYHMGIDQGIDRLIAYSNGEYEVDGGFSFRDIPLWLVGFVIAVIIVFLYLNSTSGLPGTTYSVEDFNSQNRSEHDGREESESEDTHKGSFGGFGGSEEGGFKGSGVEGSW